MKLGARIYVAGGSTLIGRALRENILESGHAQLVGMPPNEPDLTSMSAVEHFFAETRPEWVFMAAGMSGGIAANQRWPADLMLNNQLINAHVLAAACRYGVKKLLYLGSSCMYPRNAPPTSTARHVARWPARTFQRRLCHREAGRRRIVPGLSPAIWFPIYCRHSRQRLWAT